MKILSPSWVGVKLIYRHYHYTHTQYSTGGSVLHSNASFCELIPVDLTPYVFVPEHNVLAALSWTALPHAGLLWLMKLFSAGLYAWTDIVTGCPVQAGLQRQEDRNRRISPARENIHEEISSCFCFYTTGSWGSVCILHGEGYFNDWFSPWV